MDLTGYSTDSVVDVSFPEGMRRFVRLGQQRWPGMFLYGEPLPPRRPGRLAVARTGGRRPLGHRHVQLRPGDGGFLGGARLRPRHPEYYAVSVVTPKDPDADPFSRSVVNDFLASFGAPTAAPV